MKVDKEFIEAYNEMFKFVHLAGGYAAVEHFWEKLSDLICGELRRLAKEKGLAGCMEYWSNTLSQEGADCKLTLDTRDKYFEIEMRKCPSITKLKEPYPHYCKHCDVIYRRALEPLGFKFEIKSDFKEGKCRIRISE